MNEVEEIKARLDIVDFIGQYVQLKKTGRTYKALCPFHAEKTPSFIVSPSRQSWHCFGACGAGGDVISFVMRKDGLTFPEALRLTAERAGVKLPERRRAEEREQEHARLYAANEAAAAFYRNTLLNSKDAALAREYVARRGIDEETARRFMLGFSPPGWETLRENLKLQGFSDRELLDAGLLVDGESHPRDRFRGRLMFPIWNQKGRVIGFGARALDDTLPKYLNTAQTPIFDKGGVVYGLHLAQEAIREEGRAVIVEGYMDVIAAHQHGLRNVVAAMGTSLTERQVRTLKRFARNIVLVLDADTAGSEATLRGLELNIDLGTRARTFNPSPDVADEEEFQRDVLRIQRGIVSGAVDVDVTVAPLPQGKDPDEVIRESPEAWRAVLNEAKPLMDFWFEEVPKRFDLANPKQRTLMAKELARVIRIIEDPIVRAHYVQRLSRLALLAERELQLMLRSTPRRDQETRSRELETTTGDAREEFLLALLLQYPHLRRSGVDVPPRLLWESANQAVLEVLRTAEEIEDVKDAVPEELRPHLERLLNRRLPPFDGRQAGEALVDCVRRLERRQLAAEKQAMTALLAEHEQEMGAAGWITDEHAPDAQDERVREIMTLQLRDMETGLKLHSKERSNNNSTVGTRIDG